MATQATTLSERKTLDSLAAAVLVLDDEGVIQLCNQRVSEVLKLDERTLLGARIDDVLVPFQSIRDARSSSNPIHRPEFELDDGTEIGFSVTAYAGDPDSGTLVVMFRDITAWQQVREERDRLLQLAAVGEVLPSLLHELKNPLASITTALEVLVEETELPLQQDVHAILSEVRRLKLSFEGVGLVARELRCAESMAIDFAIREASSLLRNKATASGVALESHVRDMPLLGLDSSVVRAIVFNLVTNAVQACSPGCRVRIDASLVDEDSTMELAVTDDGPGMSPEVLASCRELFFTTKPNGSGIGLALVDRAIAAAGGSLSIESEPERGTSVTARVPVRPAPRPTGNGRNA